jgi:hypothetical protein
MTLLQILQPAAQRIHCPFTNVDPGRQREQVVELTLMVQAAQYCPQLVLLAVEMQVVLSKLMV